jgi:hypothetical protein
LNLGSNHFASNDNTFYIMITADLLDVKFKVSLSKE